jgi:hypothetical protein
MIVFLAVFERTGRLDNTIEAANQGLQYYKLGILLKISRGAFLSRAVCRIDEDEVKSRKDSQGKAMLSRQPLSSARTSPSVRSTASRAKLCSGFATTTCDITET